MDFSTFDAPVDLNGGEWIEGILGLPGVRLKVRSTQYRPFKDAFQSLSVRLGGRARDGEGALEFQRELGKVLAEHLLVDWDLTKASGIAVLTHKGKALSYSKANALKVLTANDDHGIAEAYRLGVEQASRSAAETIIARAREAAGN